MGRQEDEMQGGQMRMSGFSTEDSPMWNKLRKIGWGKGSLVAAYELKARVKKQHKEKCNAGVMDGTSHDRVTL